MKKLKFENIFVDLFFVADSSLFPTINNTERERPMKYIFPDDDQLMRYISLDNLDISSGDC